MKSSDPSAGFSSGDGSSSNSSFRMRIYLKVMLVPSHPASGEAYQDDVSCVVAGGFDR